MPQLWSSTKEATWRAALERYDAVVEAQGVARLPELDQWYRAELPGRLHSRRKPHVTHGEMVRVTEWKMARGVWRAPNLVLVKDNSPGLVTETSTAALATIPHPKAPIAAMAKLRGVGPATASAVVAALAPEIYPFFDELVAAQVSSLPEVKWTLGYYLKYADALRARARVLGDGWTPVMVERALWAAVGGKAGAV